MKCLIIDDEELARELLRNYCDRIPDLEVVGVCANARDAKEFLEKQTVDLLLLDIQMPEMSGLELLQHLEMKPLVIFTTAYAEFAQQGFELDVTDYLLKPFSFERFQKAIAKAEEWLAFSSNKSVVEVISNKDYIAVKSEHKIFRIPYSEILYIQSLREYVAFYTPSGKTMSLGSLRSLETELPSADFMRVHKSYIVAKSKVKSLEGNILYVNDEQIPIGPSYKEAVVGELF